jgi:hypothetical protein
MARIKRTTYTAEFSTVAMMSDSIGERNDCTVKALALITGATYLEAHSLLKAKGRKNGKGCEIFIVESAARQLGFNLTTMNLKSFIQRYPGRAKELRNLTTHQPLRYAAAWKDGAAYLAFTSTHALAIVDGVCHDWSVNKAMRITRLVKVEKITAATDNLAAMKPIYAGHRCNEIGCLVCDHKPEAAKPGLLAELAQKLEAR